MLAVSARFLRARSHRDVIAFVESFTGPGGIDRADCLADAPIVHPGLFEGPSDYSGNPQPTDAGASRASGHREAIDVA